MKTTISVTAKQLQNLLDVHKAHKKFDACVSDCIEIELTEATDTHNKADKVRFSAQSIYAECNNHFLGTN